MPADLTASLTAMTQLSDEALWQSAERSRLSPEADAELADLSDQQQERSLAPDERERLRALLALSDRLVLVRAEALFVLRQHGVDVTPLLALA